MNWKSICVRAMEPVILRSEFVALILLVSLGIELAMQLGDCRAAVIRDHHQKPYGSTAHMRAMVDIAAVVFMCRVKTELHRHPFQLGISTTYNIPQPRHNPSRAGNELNCYQHVRSLKRHGLRQKLNSTYQPLGAE